MQVTHSTEEGRNGDEEGLVSAEWDVSLVFYPACKASGFLSLYVTPASSRRLLLRRQSNSNGREGMKRVLAVLTVLLIAGVVLTGCSVRALKESDVSFADGMAENVLVAETQRNYDIWARDMDETMLKAVPIDKFEGLIIHPIRGKVGEYVAGSKQFSAAVESKGNITVLYMAKFTNEEQVKVTMSFKDVNGQKKIIGEFYDSPKLRAK